jgi:hypothetical protein
MSGRVDAEQVRLHVGQRGANIRPDFNWDIVRISQNPEGKMKAKFSRRC